MKEKARSTRKAEFKRLQRLSEKPLSALTVQCARLFLREYPDHGPAWLILGIALVDMARYDEAKHAIDNGIAFCPKEARYIPFAQMGRLFQQNGDYEEAAAWYRKAIEAKPQDATYHIFLGSLLAKQGHLDDAEQCFRTAVNSPEGCIDEGFFMLGLILRDQERFEEAAQCLREAIRLDPKYKSAKLALRDVQLCIKAAKRRSRE